MEGVRGWGGGCVEGGVSCKQTEGGRGWEWCVKRGVRLEEGCLQHISGVCSSRSDHIQVT